LEAFFEGNGGSEDWRVRSTTKGGTDMASVLLDAAGHRRSTATLPGYYHGRAPRNKGLRYPADPPTIEEIVAVMRAAGDGPGTPAASAAARDWSYFSHSRE
jgi:hypothetical protein